MGLFNKRKNKEDNILKEFPKQAVKDMEYFSELLAKMASGKISEKTFLKEMEILTKRQEELRERLQK